MQGLSSTPHEEVSKKQPRAHENPNVVKSKRYLQWKTPIRVLEVPKSVWALNFFPTIRGDSSSDDFMGLFRANGGFCCSFVHVKKRPVSGRSDQTKENAEKKNTLFDF